MANNVNLNEFLLGITVLWLRCPVQHTDALMIKVFSENAFARLLLGIVAAAVLLQWLPLANAMGLVVLLGALWVYRDVPLSRWQRPLLWCLVVTLVFWAATYKPEEFSYPFIFDLPGDSSSTPRYEFFANFGKGLCGFLLLYFLWTKPRSDEFIAAPKYQFLAVLLAPAVIVAVAIPALGLHLQPKNIEQILLFALGNLLIISVAEEAFMRLLLQQSLRNAIAVFTVNRWVQELVPLLMVTAIFVAIHSGLSGAAIWVYALTGFLYGLSYTLSKNIFYPIMIHFFVNQIHFSFLTYPLG